MKQASRFKRYIASVIDNFISILIMFIVSFIVAFVEIYRRNGVGIDNIENDPLYLLKASAVSMMFVMLYFALFESSKFSATPGKIVFKMRVLTKDNVKLKFWRSCFRFWLLQVPLFTYMISGTNYFVISSQYVSVITITLGLIWFLPIYFTKDRKCMHDILSGTKVVKVETTVKSIS